MCNVCKGVYVKRRDCKRYGWCYNVSIWCCWSFSIHNLDHNKVIFFGWCWKGLIVPLFPCIIQSFSCTWYYAMLLVPFPQLIAWSVCPTFLILISVLQEQLSPTFRYQFMSFATDVFSTIMSGLSPLRCVFYIACPKWALVVGLFAVSIKKIKENVISGKVIWILINKNSLLSYVNVISGKCEYW